MSIPSVRQVPPSGPSMVVVTMSVGAAPPVVGAVVRDYEFLATQWPEAATPSRQSPNKRADTDGRSARDPTARAEILALREPPVAFPAFTRCPPSPRGPGLRATRPSLAGSAREPWRTGSAAAPPRRQRAPREV